jgi:hypothetical protein
MRVEGVKLIGGGWVVSAVRQLNGARKRFQDRIGYNKTFTLSLAALLRKAISGKRFRYVVIAFQAARNHVASKLNNGRAGDAKRHDRIQRCLLKARRVKETRRICRPRIP